MVKPIDFDGGVALLAQLVERNHGKVEVNSSSLLEGSKLGGSQEPRIEAGSSMVRMGVSKTLDGSSILPRPEKWGG